MRHKSSLRREPAGHRISVQIWLVMDADRVVRAAAAVLGKPLRDPGDLSGSERSAVLRCTLPDGGSVVVKAYPQTRAGRRGCAAEAAGLEFSSTLPSGGSGPRLLGLDREIPLVVMSDLGSAPSLADLLLGSSQSAAVRAWLDWSVACGRLAAASAGCQDQFLRIRGQYGGAPDSRWLSDCVLKTADLVVPLGIDVPAGLAADLADVVAGWEHGYQVFSPGDICPDNNLVTAAGIRFVDFESAEFHSVFLDAAYLRMPFSTCWCVLRMPPGLAAAGESAYRREVVTAFPDLASDAAWEAGALRASAAWTIHAMSYLLDRAVSGDASMNDDVAAAPGRRQLLRYRWQTLGDQLGAAGALPALAELMRRLLSATEHWRALALPLYPALRLITDDGSDDEPSSVMR